MPQFICSPYRELNVFDVRGIDHLDSAGIEVGRHLEAHHLGPVVQVVAPCPHHLLRKLPANAGSNRAGSNSPANQRIGEPSREDLIVDIARSTFYFAQSLQRLVAKVCFRADTKSI
jgi:hypothetical protein